MSSYNLMTREGRNRMRADDLAELTAVEQGKWPRNLNDSLRWMHGPVGDRAAYAARMCKAELRYLDDLETRISAGNSDLSSYQK